MLITTIQLSLVCPTVLRKYDLRKYVNTFKARSLTSVNKYNPACGMCYVFIQIATDMAKIFYLEGHMTNLFIYSRFIGMTV